MASEALIVDAVRSPIGRRNGSLAGVRADDLAAGVLNGLVARQDLDPAEVEDVQMGCVTQIGEQGWNIGRMAPMVAGWPETVCGTTVDRQCGSSMQTNFNAAAAIMAGQLDLIGSGGVDRNYHTVVVPKNNKPANVNAVNAEAAVAAAFAESNGGTPPPGYFVIGDGPVIGPKQ